MQVEARAALVGERPAHEGREEPLPRRDLLHGGLEHERAVGCVERGGVLHVDLVLRVHELVVRRERLEPELVAPEEHAEDDLAWIGDGADGVDPRELVDVTAEAALVVPVALRQEELELGGDDRHEVACRRSRSVTRRRSARGHDGQWSEPSSVHASPRHQASSGMPRHAADGREVRPDGEVDVPDLAADDGRVPQVGSHDGRAEVHSLLAEAGEVPERDVLAARDAVQVGVEQAHGTHALPGQLVRDRLRVVRLIRSLLVISVMPSPVRACA